MHQVQSLLRKIYRGVGSSRSKRLENLLDRGEWALLQKESISDPRVYQNAGAYLRDALVVEITRKLLLPGDTEARREAAVRTFWVSEDQCARTNLRLSRYLGNQGPFEHPSELRVAEFITQWRKNVSLLLGPLPKDLTPLFSGGSTLSDKGKATTIPDKMSSQPTMYLGGLDVARHCFRKSYADMYVPTPVRHNLFFTVPKDSQKDRGCCMEASMAVSLQLAVGKELKRRYKSRFQVDLSKDSEALHHDLARAGSVYGSCATIDLSNASDTVAKTLIELLLPEDWLMLLNSLRADYTQIDGRMVRLEKFSSMGNGFTFELETIVFRTLAETIGVRHFDALVFGDDIIIPTEHSAAMIAALRFFGFTPNAKKTFCEGPFRESCGGDYFLGTPVRAHYMKEIPDEPQKWIALANGLRRADPDFLYLRSAWRYCVDQVPVAYRLFGPEALGDAVIYEPDAKPTVRPVSFTDPRTGKLDKTTTQYLPCWQILRSLPVTVSRSRFHPDIQIASAILGVEERVPLRKSISGWKKSWVLAWGVADKATFL